MSDCDAVSKDYADGFAKGREGGEKAAEARIIAWLNAEAESLRHLCAQPGIDGRETIRDSAAAIFRVKEAIERGEHRK